MNGAKYIHFETLFLFFHACPQPKFTTNYSGVGKIKATFVKLCNNVQWLFVNKIFYVVGILLLRKFLKCSNDSVCLVGSKTHGFTVDWRTLVVKRSFSGNFISILCLWRFAERESIKE